MIMKCYQGRSQNPFFPPKTWSKSRYLLQWKLVRSFSEILCTWVDFVTWTSWVFIFVHSKDTQTHSEWRDYSYSRNAHICSFGIQRSPLNSLLLLTTYHTGICIQAILTCLGYESVIQWEVTFSILKYQPSPVLWWKRKYTNTKHLRWSHICKALSVQNCFKS